MEFVVLPDTPAGVALAARLRALGLGRVVEHASGRPWIVGDWPAGQVVSAAAGPRRLAVLGCALTSPEQLTRALERARTPRDLDALAGTLAGSFHLAASLDGEVRVQGSLSTARQVFHTTLDGQTLAADRPGPLVALTDAAVDAGTLAARLLAPWPPWPLAEQPCWEGVEALPLGHYLELRRDGTGRTVRWWSPPAPEIPLAEGARRVRAALADAVAARARQAADAPLSADLSGGMDSTSLSFLAAGHPGGLVTTRWEATDPADEDQLWARRACAAIPDAEHLVLPRDEAPSWFADLLDPDPDVEAPFAWIRTRARLAYQARRLAERGSTGHLTGHGGDELFLATPLALHTIARTHPWRAVRHLRAHRAMGRWRLGPALRALAADPSFAQWFAGSARALTAPPPEVSRRPDFGWGISPRMPTWATDHAVETARHLLRETARRRPGPLAPLRAQHANLQDVRLCGDTLRRVDRLTSRNGVAWHAPYVDDRVVEAALAIRLEDVALPDRYKPALAEAMRGTVPEANLGRASKSEYSAEAYASLRRHRAELLELTDDMQLSRLGLVNADALRTTLLALPPSSRSLMPLISTFACEVWLRSLAAAPAPPTPAAEPASAPAAPSASAPSTSPA
ncbi:asparagine synthase [Allostreptomyces psammosilenae]|uniref:asparagine synthase (glutamine-hydrolyzing) n=1 Tax=Allostreptomyces psammosilenae TaxID=1892865 RepID=A0A852ZZN3_9ACTN|nr:asparagine synthase [Allostreptomyces psammosilenae]NYI07609.1 asparagine synthase (glutamine-hydrolyzing) [Allostreptomyces psammosilenae]